MKSWNESQGLPDLQNIQCQKVLSVNADCSDAAYRAGTSDMIFFWMVGQGGFSKLDRSSVIISRTAEALHNGLTPRSQLIEIELNL